LHDGYDESIADIFGAGQRDRGLMTMMARWVRMILLVALALVLAALAVWTSLVLFFSPLLGDQWRNLVAGFWLVLAAGAFVAFWRRRWRIRSVAVTLCGVTIVLAGWSTLQPSNQREWQGDVAVLPSVSIDGDMVTIRNIRNANYRSETDFDIHYYDRTFDLRRLESVDLISVYWMGPAIAHTMLSFGFGGGDFVAVSIEARKERSEGYSTIKGFFRQYELVYVVADERDVVRLRTNYRKEPPETVYLYRIPGSAESQRRLFLDYMREVDELQRHPAWYNSATRNCTGNIWLHAAVNPGHVPFSWKILVSGYVPEYLYEKGRLMPGVPFDVLRQKGMINARAQAADRAADFSVRIRAGIPGYEHLDGNQDRMAR